MIVSHVDEKQEVKFLHKCQKELQSRRAPKEAKKKSLTYIA
jgi:hypothetical protein